jgi:hypothetical protein
MAFFLKIKTSSKTSIEPRCKYLTLRCSSGVSHHNLKSVEKSDKSVISRPKNLD